MDFLKTLLLYMTVTMATTVQEGPLPEDVPTPTVAPAAIVQEQETSDPSAMPGLQVDLPSVPTDTPAPTAVPEPTITPNKAYKNVTFGDRGNDVRKLQERLIELGYLPEGSADGAFGYQTSRAVREFQKKNGLSSDGVAGPATLTRLYEDPDVIAAATAAPTGTPEPSVTPEELAGGQTIAPPESNGTEATETPAVTNGPVAAVPVTEAPAEETVEGPLPGLTQVTGATIAMGETGAPLAALRLVDGVMMPFYPRVWLNQEGVAVVSLRDMVDSVTSWVLEIDGNVFILTAAGYEVTLTETGCTVDGEELALSEGDVLFDGEDAYVTEDFLRLALKANVLWDADEHTLMLKVPEKEAAQAND